MGAGKYSVRPIDPFVLRRMIEDFWFTQVAKTDALEAGATEETP